jgi:beta-glucosidase
LLPSAIDVQNQHAIQRWFIEETRLDISPVFTNEENCGQCYDRATLFPAQCGRVASWDKVLIRQIAEITVCEANVLRYQHLSPNFEFDSESLLWKTGRMLWQRYLSGWKLEKQMVLGLQSNVLDWHQLLSILL